MATKLPRSTNHTIPSLTLRKPFTQTKIPDSLPTKSASKGKGIEGQSSAVNPLISDARLSTPGPAIGASSPPHTALATESQDPRLSVWDRSYEPLAFLTHNFKVEEVESYYNEKGIVQIGQEAADALLHAANLFAYTVGKAKLATDAECQAWEEADVKTREAANLKTSLNKYGQQNKLLKEELAAVKARAESKIALAEKKFEDLKASIDKIIEEKENELAKAQEDLNNVSATLAEFKEKYVAFSAKNFKVGFEACQEQIVFLAPNFDMSAMGPFKSVNPEGIVDPDLPEPGSPHGEDDDDDDDDDGHSGDEMDVETGNPPAQDSNPSNAET